MQKSPENTVCCLKEIIQNNGPSYFADEPYKTYETILETDAADRKTAAALLYVLRNGVPAEAGCGDAQQLSEIIQSECSLRKKMADRLADILVLLYSEDNKTEWRHKDRDGLRQFLQEPFVCAWNGFAEWDAGAGTIECVYKAEIVLEPTEEIAADRELAERLEKNPFLDKETMHHLFESRLTKYLDQEFEDYCEADDYYPPCAEDFGGNLEYDLPEWSRKNGFAFVSVDGSGYDGDFAPKFRHW